MVFQNQKFLYLLYEPKIESIRASRERDNSDTLFKRKHAPEQKEFVKMFNLSDKRTSELTDFL